MNEQSVESIAERIARAVRRGRDLTTEETIRDLEHLLRGLKARGLVFVIAEPDDGGERIWFIHSAAGGDKGEGVIVTREAIAAYQEERNGAAAAAVRAGNGRQGR
jgi:hypothetical protein